MATGCDTSAIPDEYLEERIMAGLFSGPFDKYESLVDALQDDIDTRFLKQRTLLHVAVSLGKVDWVEGLLLRGADTNIKDIGQASPLTSAEEMRRRYPDSQEHAEILRLVRVVNKSEQSKKMRGKGCDSSDTTNSDVLPTNITRDAQSDIVALQASINHMKEEIASLITKVEELQRAISCRDTLLECTLTSSAEKLNSLNERPETLFTVKTEGPNSDLIEVLMRKTEIFERDEEKEASVRSIYKYLHDEHEITATILKFLAKQPQFKAKVDCDSYDVLRLTPKDIIFAFHNNYEYKGRRLIEEDMFSFADFSNGYVYVGGEIAKGRQVEWISAYFARSLTQMALYLAFQNDGLPYQSSDTEAKKKFVTAMRDAPRERVPFNKVRICYINFEVKRHLELMPIVPMAIAVRGSSAVESFLQIKVPDLLEFFTNHVMPTLLAKTNDL